MWIACRQSKKVKKLLILTNLDKFLTYADNFKLFVIMRMSEKVTT